LGGEERFWDAHSGQQPADGALNDHGWQKATVTSVLAGEIKSPASVSERSGCRCTTVSQSMGGSLHRPGNLSVTQAGG
jgi:hypothetical protein